MRRQRRIDGYDVTIGRVAVVVVNWNAGDLLRRCVESLAAQTCRPEAIIVVDNSSSDDSLSFLDLPEYETVRVIRMKENTGFARANNEPLRELGDMEWIALLNPDAEPEPNWLEALLVTGTTGQEFAVFASTLIMAKDHEVLDGAGDDYHVSG